MPAPAEVPILVVSCDRYADVWRPFFEIFFRRWPDCPYPLRLGTNSGRYDDPRVTTIDIGEDFSWAAGVQSMLDRLGSEHVILFLEDFLIQEPVDGPTIANFLEIARRERVASIRLSPLPPPSALPSRVVPAHPELGVVEPGTGYRVSVQPAIWRVDALRRYLVPGFSPWQFEEIGSRLSDYTDDVFWGPFQPTVVYEHAVEKGRWKQTGLVICREAGVAVDLAARTAFAAGEHEEMSRVRSATDRLPSMKRQMVDAFRGGDRRRALSIAREVLRGRPMWPEALLIVAVGLLGPGPMRLLDQMQLALKVRRSRREYGRAAARNQQS
jgi:hypothetical protein